MGRTSGIRWQGLRIEGIVFDVDGTLTDSVEMYYEVFYEATARFGIHVNREDVLGPMATGSHIWDQAIPRDIPDREDKIKQIAKVVSDIFPKKFEHVQPFPEAEDVLRELKVRGMKIGVVTSSWASVFKPLRVHSLDQYIDAYISRSDGLKIKPAPDGILECLRRMEVAPPYGITVGDAPMDIRAGKAAGTLTIGVLSGIGNLTQLETEAPTAIINGIGGLLTFLDVL